MYSEKKMKLLFWPLNILNIFAAVSIYLKIFRGYALGNFPLVFYIILLISGFLGMLFLGSRSHKQ